MDEKYTFEATRFIEAIVSIASKPENLENLKSYLSMHFGTWLEKYANSPADIARELKEFAEMEL